MLKENYPKQWPSPLCFISPSVKGGSNPGLEGRSPTCFPTNLLPLKLLFWLNTSAPGHQQQIRLDFWKTSRRPILDAWNWTLDSKLVHCHTETERLTPSKWKEHFSITWNSPGIFLDCGRRPACPKKFHACPGRTSKIHTNSSHDLKQGLFATRL